MAEDKLTSAEDRIFDVEYWKGVVVDRDKEIQKLHLAKITLTRKLALEKYKVKNLNHTIGLMRDIIYDISKECRELKKTKKEKDG